MVRKLGMALALLVAASSTLHGQRGLAGKADFIFSGTNMLPRAATIDLEDASSFAIVRVDRLLFGGPAFQPLVGRTISVQLREPAKAEKGERRVYFVNAWHWGEDIGVVEVGSVPAPPADKFQTLQADIAQERQRHADSVLTRRLVSSDLVVIGKVVAVRRSELRFPGTEHDPELWEADIAISTVLRGAGPRERLTVLFPTTEDPMWRGTPRFRTGMEGIWLLRTSTFASQKLPRLMAPERDDYRPRSEEARIRRLLSR